MWIENNCLVKSNHAKERNVEHECDFQQQTFLNFINANSTFRL